MRGRHQRPIWPRCGRLMGNIGTETESMEQRPESDGVIAVEGRFAARELAVDQNDGNLGPIRAIQGSVLNGLA